MEEPTLRARRAGGESKPPHGARAKAEVLSDAGKGSLTAGQVGDEETNASEPLLTHRKVVTTTPKPGASSLLGQRCTLVVHPQPGGDLCVVLAASGVEAA